ncbi:bacillithiol biosynthesis cysteine-adding enzyme BshC [Putridiphycobacter roseus]|uniref:Putative cysteine ligase BshC n=1 Tax=Putridiphycobacter roseus TaxID=2219161 RepID=A0A2W1NKS0_9FLAO|nr:bacillithiol biosynthesis cysteine-adding enzyme BshC [Putridiphycobacter roseus]PZE18456.1 bacillithiol biosynthesis cysteine-adding enzyme BshC [Putridiphycobacter roseus]
MIKPMYSFAELEFSSPLIRDLIAEKSTIKPLVNHFFSEENLIQAAKNRQFSQEARITLQNVLQRQNETLNLSIETKNNIDRITDENTFTVTTGHQLNLGTGPLYTIYKILEVINWAKKVNSQQEDIHMVPVFWMATEDHDFDEINHLHLFGNKVEWNHANEKGSIVGRLETKGMDAFVDEVFAKFGDEQLKGKVQQYLSAYQKANTLGASNRMLINEFFGDYGLVIIDGDDQALKKEAVSIFSTEVTSSVILNAVNETNEYLSQNDYHQQVFVRPCNLFYIQPNGVRDRIEREEDDFTIGTKKLTEDELLEEIKLAPERFSPNALLRPVYQETVLPNLVYVGGGGEIAYWLQLKSSFEGFEVDFPLLKVRDSVLLMNEKLVDTMNEFGYSLMELKMPLDDLLKDYMLKNQGDVLSLASEKEDLVSLKEKLMAKAMSIDANAERFVEAEFQKMENQLDKMEKKFMQAEKKNHEKSLKQLSRLKNSIYPNGGFQERYDNIFMHIQNETIIHDIQQHLFHQMIEQPVIHVINV